MKKHAPIHHPTATDGQRSQMLLWGYGFGATLIGLGLLTISIALGSALRSATRGVQRIPLPGRSVVTLKEGFHVGILPVPSKGPALSPKDVAVTVTGEDGTAVSQMPFPPEMIQANRKIGTSLFQIQIPFDARYAVEGRLAEGAPPAELLLVHESLSRNRSDIIVGVILLVVLSGFGIYILILTYRKGSRTAKQTK